MENLPEPHEAYRRIVDAAQIRPEDHLSPDGMDTLGWLAEQDERVVAGLVELLVVTRRRMLLSEAMRLVTEQPRRIRRQP